MEEKFELKENMFLGFIFRYTPPFIMGSICIAVLNIIFKTASLNKFLIIILFVGAVLYAFLPLLKTKRQLLVSDNSIVVMNDNPTKPVVLQSFDVRTLKKVTEHEPFCYIFEYTDGKQDVLNLAYFVPPKQEMIFNINKAFEKLLGDRFVAIYKQELQENISNNTVPQRVLDFDESLKKNMLLGLAVCIIFGALPTVYALMVIVNVLLKYIH